MTFAVELRTLAAAALDADAQLLAAVRSKPSHLGTDWLEWFDATYAPAREHRVGCVRAFVGGDGYVDAHRVCWGDEITVGSVADVAWIPVARLVTNALV